MKAMVIYSSQTGNTQKVAAGIFSGIPGENKDIQEIGAYSGTDADIFFVGFWTDRGNCDKSVATFLSGLSDKRVVLFGTSGMGGDAEYYKRIEENVRKWIPDSCIYLGSFLCQGKMPIQVRRKYESMEKDGTPADVVRRLIHNFDEALLHPNEEDILRAAAFAGRMVEQAENME